MLYSIKDFFFVFIILIFLGSCTTRLSLQVVEQPEIKLPEYIKNIVVVNKLHQFEKRTDYCVNALVEVLSKYPYYKVSVVPFTDSISKDNFRLSPSILKKICITNNADAVISLEQFNCDYDDQVFSGTSRRFENRSAFNFYWQTYDRKSEAIIDHVNRGDHLTWIGYDKLPP